MCLCSSSERKYVENNYHLVCILSALVECSDVWYIRLLNDLVFGQKAESRWVFCGGLNTFSHVLFARVMIFPHNWVILKMRPWEKIKLQGCKKNYFNYVKRCLEWTPVNLRLKEWVMEKGLWGACLMLVHNLEDSPTRSVVFGIVSAY